MGSAWPMEEELTADIRGRDLISGLPRTIQLTTEHVREAMAEPVAAIVDAVKTTLDKTPPELAADIMEDGITITGGGALLGGLRRAPRPRDRHADPRRRRAAVQRRHRLRAGPREHRRHARPDVAGRRRLTPLDAALHAGTAPGDRPAAADVGPAADAGPARHGDLRHRPGRVPPSARAVRGGRRRRHQADPQRLARHHGLRRAGAGERAAARADRRPAAPTRSPARRRSRPTRTSWRSTSSSRSATTPP